MQEITNPVALMDYTTNSKTRTSKLIGGVFGELNFGKLAQALTGLTFRTSFGGEFSVPIGRQPAFGGFGSVGRHPACDRADGVAHRPVAGGL